MVDAMAYHGKEVVGADDYQPPLSSDIDGMGSYPLASVCLLAYANNPHPLDMTELQQTLATMCGSAEPEDAPSVQELEMARTVLLNIGMIEAEDKDRAAINDTGLMRGIPLAGAFLTWYSGSGSTQSMTRMLRQGNAEISPSQYFQYYQNALRGGNSFPSSASNAALDAGMRGLLTNLTSLQGAKTRDRFAAKACDLMESPHEFSKLYHSYEYIPNDMILKVASLVTQEEVAVQEPSEADNPAESRSLADSAEPVAEPESLEPDLPVSPAQSIEGPTEPLAPKPRRRRRRAPTLRHTLPISTLGLSEKLFNEVDALATDTLVMACLFVYAKNPGTRISPDALRKGFGELLGNSTYNLATAAQLRQACQILGVAGLIDFNVENNQAIINDNGLYHGLELAGAAGGWILDSAASIGTENVLPAKASRVRFDVLQALVASGGTISSVIKLEKVLGHSRKLLYKQIGGLASAGVVEVEKIGGPGRGSEIALVGLTDQYRTPVVDLMERLQSLVTEEGRLQYRKRALSIMDDPSEVLRLLTVHSRMGGLGAKGGTIPGEVQAFTEDVLHTGPFEGCPATLPLDINLMAVHPILSACLLVCAERPTEWLTLGQIEEELRARAEIGDRPPDSELIKRMTKKLVQVAGFLEQRPEQGSWREVEVRVNEASLMRAMSTIGVLWGWRFDAPSEVDKKYILSLTLHSPASYIGLYAMLLERGEVQSLQTLRKQAGFSMSSVDLMLRALKRDGVIDVRYKQGSDGQPNRLIDGIRLNAAFQPPIKELVDRALSLRSETGRLVAALRAGRILYNGAELGRLVTPLPHRGR